MVVNPMNVVKHGLTYRALSQYIKYINCIFCPHYNKFFFYVDEYVSQEIYILTSHAKVKLSISRLKLCRTSHIIIQTPNVNSLQKTSQRH